MRSADDIFHDAREIADPAARAAFLDEACKGDAGLRSKVDQLLRADAELGGFLASREGGLTTLDPVPLSERPGSRIGPYKLLQVIGEGGFGTVFLAEQTEPVRRKVAVKIIKLGMDTRQVIARFEAERQALAVMNHPHIARVFDGGVTDSGRPFFVMEYVVGEAITQFSDTSTLSVAERLDLFRQVCAAVQHAHTKGIIHRDLKPANVLVSMVDGKPYAKVIDFGIAKATASPLTDKTLFTEHRQLIGTPEYMSPEQAEGSPDIDTRTDVYALGVLLYELLTGLTPLDGKRLRSAAYGEMQRIIKEEEPLAPSLRLTRSPEILAATAAHRRTEPDRLGPQVRGELDWIVMKALDKDRGRRYESAAQLATDIGNHLAGDAVVAAPPSRSYRIRKFVRRHKTQTTIAITLLLGLAGTTTGLLIANFNAKAALHNADLVRMARDELQIKADSLMRQRDITREAMINIGSIIDCGDCGEALADGFYHGWLLSGSAEPYVGDPEDELRLRALGALGEQQAKELIRQTNSAEWSAYTANITLAQQALDAGNYPEARKRLSDCPEGKRGWEWTFTNLQCSAVSHQIEEGSECLFSPVDSRVAVYSNNTYSNENIVWIYDNTDFENAIAIKRVGNTEYLHSVAWSPDGTQLLLSVSDGTAQIHKADGTGTPLVLKTDSRLRSAEWNHDGTQILTVGDEAVQTWDATGTQRKTIVKSRGEAFISDAHWSPTNDSIAVVFSDGSTGLTSPKSDEFLDLLGSSKTCPWRLNWSSNGERFAIVPNQIAESVRILNANGSSVHEIPSYGSSTSIDAEWDPSGHRLLVGFTNGKACIYNVTDGTTMYLEGAHSDAIWDLCWSPDGTKTYTASYNGIVCWDAMKGTPLGPVVSEPSDDPWHVSALPDGQSLLVSNSLAYEWGPATQVIPIDAWGGPKRGLVRAWRDIPASVYFDRINATTNGSMIAGDSIVTPDGSRRIEYTGRALRFISEATGKEVAVLGFAIPIASLSLTSDGNQLIVSMENGYSYVWDIRDADTRRMDLQIEWAERVPAGAYLDTLWNGDTPTESLMDAIIADQLLTPLRRLVAAEMLDERQREAQWQAEGTFKELADGQTDKAAVLEAARAAKVHPRVRELLVARAEEWEYTPPKASTDELLAEEQRKRALAEATIVIREFTDRDAGGADDNRLAMLNLEAAVASRREYLGLNHPETIEAELIAAHESDLNNKEWIDKLIDLSERVENTAEPRRDELRISIWSYLAWRLWYSGDMERSRDYMNSIGMLLPIAFANDPLTHYQVVYPSWPPNTYHFNQPSQDEIREISNALDSITVLALHRSRAEYGYRESDFTTCSLHIELAISQRVEGHEDPRDFAFLAMSRYKLGEIELAESAIARASSLLEDPTALNEAGVPWSQDRDALELLAEAEKLIQSDATHRE